MTTEKEMVWTVDKYCDRIIQRNAETVAREQNHPYFSKKIATFNTQEEAIKFCIHRAERGVIDAKKDLDLAWKRLKRMTKKLAAVAR